jgi:hypothetical protein
MNPAPRLPRATLAKLASPAPKGQRHAQIVEIACGLAGSGLDGEAIFRLIRPNYGPDVQNGEIYGVIRWALNRFKPGFKPGFNGVSARWEKRFQNNPVSGCAMDPETAVKRFTKGRAVSEADIFEASPVPLSGFWRDDFPLFLSALYGPDDLVNVVTDYRQEGGKARPFGKGKTLTRDEWLSEAALAGPPQGEGGAWLRMNPMTGAGVKDGDVRAWRFCLLECDTLTPALQLALFAGLPFPIAALVTSGGRSIHAWVRVDSPSDRAYRETVLALFQGLKPYGVDPANKNPSRLARMPGAQRAIGRVGDGRQRLLYLAPAKTALEPIFPV